MTLRILGGAALAAVVLASDVVILTLLLNPQASLARDAEALGLSLFAPYLVVGWLVLALLGLLAQALPAGVRPLRPPLEGMPWLTSLLVLATAAAAALFWINLYSYRHSVPLEFLRALVGSAVALTGNVLLLCAVVADAWLFPARGRALASALVVLCGATAVAVPLALRPQLAAAPHPARLALEPITPASRVVLLGIDGLSAGTLGEGIAAGRLPGLARLLRRGAHGPLATLRPTEGPPVWTSIFTGVLPRDHGIKSFVSYRLQGSDTVFELLPKAALVGGLERMGLVTTSPVPSSARRRPALWNALNAFGIPAGVVRVWATHPVERIQGFMLSNYFHVVRGQARAAEAVSPPDLLAEVRAKVVDADHVDAALVSEFVDASALEDEKVPWRRDLLERALAPDLTYQRAGAVLRAAYDPPFFATYVYGVDVASHAFLRQAQPERFGDVSPEEVRRYGRVVERYTALVAEWIDEAARGLGPEDVLLVVSGYGVEPQPLWRRVAGALSGAPAPSGTHADAPDGFLLAVGRGIRPGVQVQRASVLDVTPTVLYLMGLPVGRDMEGRVLADMVSEDFARSHPLTFIPSYQSLAVAAAPAGAPPLDLPPLPDALP